MPSQSWATPIRLGSGLARSASLRGGAHDAVLGTDAQLALLVPRQGVLPREGLRAVADVGLELRVRLDVAPEVVLADEAAGAVGALVLAVVEVRLDVALEVLLAPEFLVAAGEGARELVSDLVGSGDVLLDRVGRDARLDLGLFHVEVLDAGGAGDAGGRGATSVTPGRLLRPGRGN